MKKRTKNKSVVFRVEESFHNVMKARAEKLGLDVSKYLTGLVYIDITDEVFRKHIIKNQPLGFMEYLRGPRSKEVT